MQIFIRAYVCLKTKKLFLTMLIFLSCQCFVSENIDFLSLMLFSVQVIYLVLNIFWFPPLKAVSAPNGICDLFSAICTH